MKYIVTIAVMASLYGCHGVSVGDRVTINPRDPLRSVRVGGRLVQKENLGHGVWWKALDHDCVVSAVTWREATIACTPLREPAVAAESSSLSGEDDGGSNVLIGYQVEWTDADAWWSKLTKAQRQRVYEEVK